MTDVSKDCSEPDTIVPLTSMQEGILFHSHGDEEGTLYTRSFLIEIGGASALRSLQDALQTLIDRHDILRSAFLWEHLPRPVQVVARHAELRPIHIPRCYTVSADGTLSRKFPLPWNLQQAPLVRLLTVEGNESDKQHAILELHHLIFDQLSLERLFEELRQILAGCNSELRPSEPYGAYVSRVDGKASPQSVDYFRSLFADIEETTAQASTAQQPSSATAYGEARAELPPALVARLYSRSKALGTSPARILHAAWALSLAALTGKDDVVFGTVFLHPKARDHYTIGPQINTLPLRLRLKQLSALELINACHIQLSELKKHIETPLSVAQRASTLDSSQPLFTALLNYRRGSPNPAHTLASVDALRPVAHSEAKTNYPIALSVDEGEGSFHFTLQADQPANPARIIEFAIQSLSSLLEALEVAPGKAALALDAVPAHETMLTTRAFNDTYSSCTVDRLVHRIFERQASDNTASVAVIHGQETIRYAALNRRANQVARYLQQHGIGQGDIVGVFVNRSIAMVTTLLGVLKAGAAYMPLDPSYPATRIAMMLESGAPRAVIVDEQCPIPEGIGNARLIDSSQILRDSSVLEFSDLAQPVHPMDLAYVIFTSGSTGRPKGIAMPHFAMANLIHWHLGHMRGSRSRRVLQFSALSFDVSFQEIFTTLCTGLTLVLIDEATRKDVYALVQEIQRHRVERLFIPPLMLQALAKPLAQANPTSLALKEIVTAGEQLRVSPEVRSLYRLLPDCKLYNHYGPTESHVVTSLILEGEPVTWDAQPSIGRPIDNTQMYILNSHLQPLAVGVPGELYIGGDNLCRGYLGQPELTAQRFVASPFSTGARLYRTGDLALWREDGTIQFLGRRDEQVKIRGFRVELGEVEAQLRQQRDIKDALVVLHAGKDKYLVAYLVAHEGRTVDVAAVTQGLRSDLPEYMVPRTFVVLDAFPTTPSGKIDRRALPSPPSPTKVVAFDEPQGEREVVLAQIWCAALHVERVGRDENFFELGGHSLTAMSTIVAMAEKFKVRLSVDTLFSQPTVRRMAEYISQRSQQPVADPAELKMQRVSI